jgi:hypothetical protein
MQWLAYIGGPRESRRIVGDMILNGEDMVKGIIHPDGCVPTTWDQDLHYPKEQYAAKFPDNPFISRAEFGKHTDRANGYPVPYRCFYSQGHLAISSWRAAPSAWIATPSAPPASCAPAA